MNNGGAHGVMVIIAGDGLDNSSRIWTRVAVSITYDDNHYTTGTSKYSTRIDTL